MNQWLERLSEGIVVRGFVLALLVLGGSNAWFFLTEVSGYAVSANLLLVMGSILSQRIRQRSKIAEIYLESQAVNVGTADTETKAILELKQAKFNLMQFKKVLKDTTCKYTTQLLEIQKYSYHVWRDRQQVNCQQFDRLDRQQVNRQQVNCQQVNCQQTKQSLLESERKFQAIFNQTFQLIGLLNRDGILLELNQAAVDFVGVRLEQVIGYPFWELPCWQNSPPEIQTQLQSAIAQASAGKFVRYEVCMSDAAGHMIPFDFSLKPVFDELGQVVMIIPEGRDISSLKQVEQELKRSNQDLQQFAYVVSHDLQEPLRAITCFSQLLTEDFEGKLNEPTQTYITCILDGATRMRQLLQELLAYSRVSHGDRAWMLTDCNHVLYQVRQNLQVAITESQATLSYAPLPTLMANSIHLVQLFQNLVSNAIKFRRNQPPKITIGATRVNQREVKTTNFLGGTDPARPNQKQQELACNLALAQQSASVTRSSDSLPLDRSLDLSRQSISDFHSPNFPRIASQSEWLFWVQDNGIGIQAQYLDCIFEMFRQLHSRSQFPGSGMGLAICKKIVEQHGGRIWAESKPGVGTAFYFTIPALEAESIYSLESRSMEA